MSDITLSTSSVTLVVGEQFSILATVSPSDADNTKIIWTSGNASVARVTNGVVYAEAPGETSVVAKSDDGGKSASCSVTVLTEKVSVSGVSLDKKSVVLQKGDTEKLGVSIEPADASDKTVRWGSTDESAVSVDKDGNLTAVAPGAADIIVTTQDGGFSASCRVVVEQHVGELRFTNVDGPVVLHELETIQIETSISPDDAVDKTLIWESSNSDVASVYEGLVRAVQASTDTITVTAKTRDGGITASCKVKVNCFVKGVSFTDHTKEMKVGDKDVPFKYVVYPERATDKAVTWSSSDPKVVFVTEDGLVTALKKGSAILTVTTKDGGFTDSCNIVVENAISSMKIEPSSLSLTEEEKKMLTVVFTPASVSGETLKWSSTDEKVAVVSDSGEVTAVGAGEAVICVVSEGGLHAYCKVSVSKLVSSMSFDHSTVTLFMEGENSVKKLAPVTDPPGANVKLSWRSSNEQVVKVDDGQVTPVGPGEAVITAATITSRPENSVSATVNVTVIQEVTGITVSPSSIEMWEDETPVLDVVLTPSNASNPNYRFEVDPSSSAKLTFDKSTKKLSATAPGKAVIRFIPAQPYPQGEVVAECTVLVKAHVSEVKPQGPTAVKLKVGDTSDLKVNVIPSTSHNQKINWTSEDPSVASVNENGKVTGHKIGTTVINAVADDKANNAKASFNISVCPADVTSIYLQNLTLTEGDTGNIVSTVDPSNAFDPSLTWDSSDKTVATVDNNGKVTALKAGTTTITAKSVSTPSVSGTCTVTVEPSVIKVSTISLSFSKLSLYVGNEQGVSAVVKPDDAVDKTLEWTTSDEKIASIRASGTFCNITAVASGTATVTATNKASGKSATCTVTVSRPVINVTSVTFDQREVTISYGASLTLSPTVMPSNASNADLEWRSSDETIVTVDQYGNVDALSKTGTAVVTAVSKDKPEISASCTIHVVPRIVPVTGLSIKTEDGESTMTLVVGQVKKAIAVITPENATDKSVVWSVQQGGVIFVDQQGNVTANKLGNSRLIARTAAGDREASMQVKVVANAVASVEISHQSIVIREGDSFELSAKAIGDISNLPPSNGSINWSAEDTSVVSVSGGKVTGLKAGETTVIATSAANGNAVARCVVTVLPRSNSGGGSEGVEFDDWD